MEPVNEILKKNFPTRSRTNTETSSNAKPNTSGILGRDLFIGATGGDPDCPLCHGTGFYIPDLSPGEPGFGRAQVCPCREQQIEIDRKDGLAALSQLGLLTECTFDSFMPEGLGLTPQKQLNLKIAYQLVHDFANEPNGWLILRGGYGCGKTHLAAAVANHRIGLGQRVLFVNTPDLLDHLRASFSPSSGVSYDQRFEEVRNAPLLILDDLGTQSNTEWAQEKLYQIFNHRYTAKLPTIITTNEELESIEIRIRSRMADPSISQIVTILAPDFRRAGVGQEQSDLSTLSLHHDKTFEQFDLRDDELPRNLADNLRRAFETSKTFAEKPAGWLVLQSIAFANGKTHLAAAIANHVSRNGESALFVVVPDLMDHLRATFNPNSHISLDKRFQEVKNTPLLVLDDLGTESATPWVREKLYQLFNHRYNANLPTVITTTTPIDEIDPRLASRLLDGNRCTFFVLEAPSYRGGQAKPSRSGRRKGSRK